VANLKPADLPGTVDLAWASPPCQDLSEAGKGAGLEGERSGAFRPFMKLMQALRAEQRAPRMVVLENVEGLISRGDGKGFDEYVGALTECGYRFGAIGVNAELFVPQRRLRVFVVGVDEALRIPADIVAAGPSLPFHPCALVAACLRQKAQPIWWRPPVPPTRNTALIDVLEEDVQGDCWDTPTETDRIIAMMAPLHLAKVETPSAPASFKSAASSGAPATSRAGKSSSTASLDASGSRPAAPAASPSCSLTATRCARGFCRRVKPQG
jgi:DNA (cytosine-5)-methyltransferase 1